MERLMILTLPPEASSQNGQEMRYAQARSGNHLAKLCLIAPGRGRPGDNQDLAACRLWLPHACLWNWLQRRERPRRQTALRT